MQKGMRAKGALVEERKRVAVCDDERAIADLVGQLLAETGIEPCVFYAADDLLAALAKEPCDLVVLDIMMPGMDGFSCCREIRRTSGVPIIFLTAKDEEVDKVVGFELGADDYVVKPFKPRELVARVRARLRRAAVPAARDAARPVLEARGIALDESAFTATLHGEPLALTPKEFAILACLLRAEGRPVASRELFEEVWREEANAQSNNTVMVHIRHLRKKLAAVDSSQEFVETVWGVGYKLG
ncbi:response regulator transcription factor [Arabiibacter massiliensis]|uniref:response regulator transcription factor n=1 Tax=Arabiibacter massiliensis TaxID=1870985 RepID=UPI001E3FA77A|nr:response regulator transcription factor [Arabiibacter massiliensis]